MDHIESDQEFLDSFVASSKTLFDCMGDNVHIKDHEFKYRYASASYLTFFNKVYGFEKQEEDLLGQTLKEVIDSFGLAKRNLYEDLAKQEEELKSTRISTKLVQAVANYPQVIVAHKRPIINPASDNFVGIMTHFSTLAMPNILKTILKVNRKSSYIVSNDSNYERLEYSLTEKQHIVLFLYLHRYSAAEIASILGTIDYKMSNSRINDHLEALKYIFRVRTKDQLIEKALAMDYDLLIPRALFKEGSYLLNEAINIL